LNKVIVGVEPWLSMASEDWRAFDPEIKIISINIGISQDYQFILPDLKGFSPNKYTFFVAWNHDFLNFQRYELMGEILKLGFKMPPLIHPSAILSRTCKIFDNSWLHCNSIIRANVTIGINSCILPGSHIMANTILNKNVWIDERVTIGHDVVIGSNVYIGPNMTTTNNIKISRNSRIMRVRHLCEPVQDNYFEIKVKNYYQTATIVNYQ